MTDHASKSYLRPPFPWRVLLRGVAIVIVALSVVGVTT